MAKKKLESQELTFSFGNEKLENIECSVEVDDDSNWNKINVVTKNPDIIRIQDCECVDVKISIRNITGDSSRDTEINKASVQGFGMSLGRKDPTFSFYLYPKEVYIYHRYARPTERRKVTLHYYINKAPMISPYYRLIPNELGEVKKNSNPSLEIILDNKIKIKSEVAFSYSLQGDDFESKRYQRLTTSFSRKRNVVNFIQEEISPQVDDLLMLSSLLHDGKVAYTSWKAEADGLTILYYKSSRKKADDNDSGRFKNLIEPQNVRDFLTSTLKVYKKSPYKHSIDNAIYTLMLSNSTVIELSYLAYFQAFESMVLTFKRIMGTEFIFSENDFKLMRVSIEKTISMHIPDDKQLRQKVKGKLGELRRVSLKDAANNFIEHFDIDLGSLWPLFDDKGKGIIGLTSIRNVLIHGDLLPPDALRSVAIASHHLRVLLIRCVFSLLDWEIQRTQVRSDHLISTHHLFDGEVLSDSLSDIFSFFSEKK
ncbi:hypothetical protein [Pantoea sp.]|uniref:hypothetical protein n=1 Tax=Pantoea TaxID=53335 RepID=UPI0025FAE718|nr:hypothetical protein [Pantoea sp.]